MKSASRYLAVSTADFEEFRSSESAIGPRGPFSPVSSPLTVHWIEQAGKMHRANSESGSEERSFPPDIGVRRRYGESVAIGGQALRIADDAKFMKTQESARVFLAANSGTVTLRRRNRPPGSETAISWPARFITRAGIQRRFPCGRSMDCFLPVSDERTVVMSQNAVYGQNNSAVRYSSW